MIHVNKLIYIIPISFLLLTNVTAVYAAENNTKTIYLLGEIGFSNMASAQVDPYKFKNKQQFGSRLSTGYLFPINMILSLGPEVGYGYYGQVSYENSIGLVSHYKLSGWDVLANLKYMPTESVNLYFKAGINDLSQQLVIVGPNATPGGFYQMAIKPMIVLAGSYNIFKKTELSISYTHIFANKAPLTSNPQFTFTNVNQICSVDAAMIGFSYYI